MFRPPGAPGGELRRWQPPDTPAPRAGEAHPVADRPSREPVRTDGAGRGDGGAAPSAPRAVRGWRWAGVAASAVLGWAGGIPYLSDGVTWYSLSASNCRNVVATSPTDVALRQACQQQTSLDWWQLSRFGVLLALATGVVLLVRLARRGPDLLDVLAPVAAGIAVVLAVRSLVDRDGQALDLDWAGPLVIVPLLGVLVAASARACLLAHPAGLDLLARVTGRGTGLVGGRSFRLPGWLRPASIWRRRRRWLVGVGLVCVVLLLHGIAGTDTGPGDGAAHAQLGGHPPAGNPADPTGSGGSGGSGPSRAPSTTPAPDGARLLAATSAALARAHSVTVHLDSLRGTDVTVDLQLTADGRADGTVTTPHDYRIRRVGSRCWVQHLPGYGLLDWVPTCTIPAYRGVPAIDLARLTDWRVMVATLPDPAGARAQVPAGDGPWQISTADGSTVYLTGARRPDPLPQRVRSAQPRPGGARDIDYSGWNEPATITPP